MARQYWYLFVREDGIWSLEFGDYDRFTVLLEQEDWLDHFDDFGNRRHRKDTLVQSFKSDEDWRWRLFLDALNDPGMTLDRIKKISL